MMKRWLKQTKNEKGLTLVELLAVVVILGIIAAIAVPSIGNIIENSKKDSAISNAQQVLNAARLYSAGGGNIDSSITYNSTTNGAIAEYHEELVNPWGEGEVTYTVGFENNTPNIAMTYSGGKCNIGTEGSTFEGLSSQDLSSDSRDNICKDDE
ncbi:type II secretion system protein [Alkalihalophilus pseudofirmus]|uniref:type II secretion system protein n=1 Tax=Alkalihalophilus pseudofirmus TaxID=79885 RepID=UPI00259B0AC2|nr:type II secretion system protein [Alkalihalophilus pseudofirmus]WEG16110.1 type II secretion system protein [Alkalihalophilus pseudofirmus]